ncbi:Ribosomal protein L11 methylase [Aminobacter sp. J15]|nr:Ribosomal protein L11 methylase [Aminobacter sp. J15]
MLETGRNLGSFRDPSGSVYTLGSRIFRTVNEVAREAYEKVRDAGVIGEFTSEGRIVGSREVPRSEWPFEFPSAAYLIEHDRVPFISYPYEWSFSELKAAALHHLDLQIDLLKRDVVLSDATAYNVQFVGPDPVFIDLLSLRPYREGEFWQGHRQFCEQFLNPLILRSVLGVPHNAWFRGSLEGIPTLHLANMLPLRKRLSWNMLSQVVMPAKLEQRALNAPDESIEKAKSNTRLSRTAYNGFLVQLRNWIARMEPADTGKTVWGEYAHTHTYTDEEARAKKAAIQQFAAAVKPARLIDLGCNTGDYSVAALEGGAQSVIGFDFDQRAVDLAYSRAREQKLNYLPLWLDAANPSPDQGWKQGERSGFASRAKADALIALAFEHHLAIGRNVPLDDVVDWLVGIAPVGIIEFVPKNDSTVQKMLALREDIFPDYTEEVFEAALARRAAIVGKKVISASGRTLFQYDRTDRR